MSIEPDIVKNIQSALNRFCDALPSVYELFQRNGKFKPIVERITMRGHSVVVDLFDANEWMAGKILLAPGSVVDTLAGAINILLMQAGSKEKVFIAAKGKRNEELEAKINADIIGRFPAEEEKPIRPEEPNPAGDQYELSTSP